MPTATLQFRVQPGNGASFTFSLPMVDGETVAALKARMSPHAGAHQDYFLLSLDGRPLRLVEGVASLVGSFVGASGAVIDVSWSSCSHGAPIHPLTHDSPCFWDGGAPPGPVEY